MISKKKENQLYSLVHDHIMDARIEICLLIKAGKIENIDDILSDLSIKAPQAAINLFNKKTDGK